MWCGWIPTRPCVCDPGDDHCGRYDWQPPNPVGDDWRDDGDDD